MRALALFLLVVAPAQAGAPLNLVDTGLHGSGVVAFAPQYPLWSDGSAKRRWLYLPPGTAIDKSNPDAWDFPPGTKAWKEFSQGRRIETRYIERLPDGAWRFAAYQWNEAGTQALLAPEKGVPALGIPSRADCLACHEAAPAPILGYSAVQLSDAVRDPALGYLHANCGHCHNDSGPLAAVELSLAQSAAAPRASAARTHATLAARADDVVRRLRSTNPYVRMPPLGVRVPDAQGAALVERLISHLKKETPP